MRIRAVTTVGRQAATRTIEDLLGAARAGDGGCVLLTGDGGIGKSRLLATAVTSARTAGMAVLRGRGSATGPMVPFRALTEALLCLTRSGAPIDPQALGPYRPILGRLIPDWAQPGDRPENGSVVVLGEAVLRLSALAGRQRGCLLALDDLQDADAESLTVVEYLIDNLHQQPIALLGALRCEAGAARDLTMAAAQRATARLVRLGRLTRDQLDELVAACLGVATDQVPVELAERVWADSAGVPLLAEELLDGLIDAGTLVEADTGWQVHGRLQTTVPTTLVRSVARRIEALDRSSRDLVLAASVLGQRFPLVVLGQITGMTGHETMARLRGDLAGRLVAPDEEHSDWYTFSHPLVVEALQTLIAPDERRRLCRRATEALTAIYPQLPGEWCQLAATLLMHAGDDLAAGQLFTTAGRRALANGAAASAVALLRTAQRLLTDDRPGFGPVVDALAQPLAQPVLSAARAEAAAALVQALTEAGMVEQAIATAGEFDRAAGLIDPRLLADLHTRIAWAAALAGRHDDAMAQLRTARGVLGHQARPEDQAPIDIVEAHLALDEPGPHRIARAEALARKAATVAEAVPIPAVACQAWQLLGALSRERDAAEATACLERSRRLAVRHALPIWEIHALVRLGNDDALRDGSRRRLRQARTEACRVGAVTAQYQAEASLAMQAVLRGEYPAAEVLIEQVLAATTRLRLLETSQYVLLLRATCRAHQGLRRGMDEALAEFQRWRGDLDQHTPRVAGLAGTWCALMEEDRPAAMVAQRTAVDAEASSPGTFQLSGRCGLYLLLAALAGDLDWCGYRAAIRQPAAKARWNRQFAELARAVLLGRDGDSTGAVEAVETAIGLGQPYPTGRHLGLRLVSEAAIADGWTSPVDWLRGAEEYFYRVGITAAASACRGLLRRSGAPMTQRRRGCAAIPTPLRTMGITVREYEVLLLLIDRLGNREIAARLHLSPRTVENHVASLMTKTGQRGRATLAAFAAALIASDEANR